MNLSKTINTPIKTLFPRYGKSLKILKSAFEYSITAMIFILIPLIAFTLVTSRTPALLGLQSFTVLSGSMSPGIPTGSVVYTQKTTEVGVGDVITFERKGVNVTHRIIDTVDKNGKSVSSLVSPIPGAPLPKEIFYKVKGDANNAADSDLVSKDKIVGKVLFNVPAFGKYASYLKSVPGFLLFIILPTLIFVGVELWNIKKEIEKSTERKVLERMRML